MAKVTIPTASYVGRNDQNKNNLLVPKVLPTTADFNQQCKLWRFYCTCLDMGCSNYKLEDFENKNLSNKDKYLVWVKDWKMHYQDVSNLIREYKSAKSAKWLYSEEQDSYRLKFIASEMGQRKCSQDFVIDNLLSFHTLRIDECLDKLKKSAQHLLNARFTGKLASGTLRVKSKNSSGIIA